MTHGWTEDELAAERELEEPCRGSLLWPKKDGLGGFETCGTAERLAPGEVSSLLEAERGGGRLLLGLRVAVALLSRSGRRCES